MDKNILAQLEKITGKDGVLSTPEDLAVYSYDGTFAEHRPDAVVLPRTTGQVSQIVRLAARERIPVVTRGMGSGLAAASVPFQGGIALTMTRMNRILEIDEANAAAHVEAGVVTADLQAAVEKLGLFYPPDPASIRHSTIGGNIACNAGGPRCLKYGVTGDYVLGLTVVLADGRILHTGGKCIKDVVGYDLKALFTGSEGTLGVITEALLRLTARPEFARTALVEFPSVEDASQTVNTILRAGVVPAALELMDETAIACIEAAMHLGLPLDVEAILLIETDGSDEAAVLREMEAVAEICRARGARQVKVAADETERASLWRARRSLSPSLARKAPNKLGEDITVPRSAIAETVRRLKAISAKRGLPIVIYGHAGDGNLHPTLLFDKRDPGQWAKVEQMAAEEFALALELGGTLSGEHGVGTLKRPYMAQALGPVSIEIQKRIKAALDPLNILNPGKVFPD
ncbi:MAG: glycolate oxidase subunit GlcD [Anaerolineae bacterium CG17_big_fil_post_rev_8_21_14_2_50_57_27]|nr:MAG: glycolate oxidase subunit GlcD [Anaerolineae bacterium CG2_30_58_95]PIW21065.1 MAG: glycolate oxidase subunit GlcD [Anaerolineae bacterium CG17_big_fil_post_rev_8_21_14_2_50_57_27]